MGTSAFKLKRLSNWLCISVRSADLAANGALRVLLSAFSAGRKHPALVPLLTESSLADSWKSNGGRSILGSLTKKKVWWARSSVLPSVHVGGARYCCIGSQGARSRAKMHPMRDEATLPIQLAGQNAVNAHSYSRLLALYCKMPRFSAREHKQRWRRDTPALTQAWNHWQDSAFFAYGALALEVFAFLVNCTLKLKLEWRWVTGGVELKLQRCLSGYGSCQTWKACCSFEVTML